MGYMGPDPIDQQHQRLQDTINLIEEGDNEDDHPDNIQVQVNDPLYSGLFKAAAAHQGYQQAIKHRLDGDNFDWKELPTGAYTRQLKQAWPHLHVVENNQQQKLFVYEGTKFLVPPGAIEEVLEVVDTCHMGFPKAIGYAKVCKSMPEYARVYQSMPGYTRVCQIMPEYARVCQSMPVFAIVCQCMPEYARVCQSIPEYANV